MKTNCGNLLFCFLEYVCKDLPINLPATPVILSTSIPHSNQYEQHQQVLKQCANIVAQFWDGIQILIYKCLTDISKLWCERCNIYIKSSMCTRVGT